MNKFFAEHKLDYLSSPFNYTGSKYKLLPQLFEHFPKVDKMYDLFCGGGSVTVNCSCEKIIANDIITPLVNFYKWLSVTPLDEVLEEIKKRNISKDSQEEYVLLRDRFNTTCTSPYNHIDFFILICSCTNNMMRFNKSYSFNQTWGQRCFNSSTENKLREFSKKLYQNKNIEFLNKNFYDVPVSNDGFVYLDPPYYISEAGYNAYWSKELEEKMYDLLDDFDSKGIKFVLSGVSKHKNRDNPFLYRVKKYNTILVNMDYRKVARKKGGETQEIIVKNF